MTNELLFWTASDGTVLSFQTPFILQEMVGAGSAPADVQMQKAPFQDGQTLVDQLLKERTVDLTVMIVGSSRSDLFSKRRQIIRAFNPKQKQGTFTWQDSDGVQWKLDAVPQACSFPGGQAAGVTFQQALVTLVAPSPFWYQPGTLSAAQVTGGLAFPMTFPMTLATIAPAGIADNSGDVDTPVEFRFVGPCTDPKVENTTTGKSLQVIYTVPEGSAIFVNTAFGAKEVSLVDAGGAKTNVMHHLTVTSEFFMLEPGVNLLQYSESGGNTGAMMLVNWRDLYVGR